MRSYDDFADDYGSTAPRGGKRRGSQPSSTHKPGTPKQSPGTVNSNNEGKQVLQQHSPSSSSNSTNTRTPIFVRDDTVAQSSPASMQLASNTPCTAQQLGTCAGDGRCRPTPSGSAHPPGSVFSRLSSRLQTAGPSPAATPSPQPSQAPSPGICTGPSPFGAVGNLLFKAVAAATADAQLHLNAASKASQGTQLSPAASTQRVAGASSPHGIVGNPSIASSVRHSSTNSLRRQHSNASSISSTSKTGHVFQTPKVPQQPVTRVETNNRWALMLEAGIQNLESVLGPLAAATLSQMTTATSLEAESTGRDMLAAAVARPSWDAQAVLELVVSGPLSTRVTLAQGNVLREAAAALAVLQPTDAAPVDATVVAASASAAGLGLQSSTAVVATATDACKAVTPEQAVAGQQACLNVLTELRHAVQHSPLIRDAACPAFNEFLDQTLLPEWDSAVLYAEMLLADAQEAAAGVTG